MVHFDDVFKQRMRERMERFSKFDQKGDVFSKVSVTVTKGDNMLSEARTEKQEFSWTSNENGPSPLAYFVSSLAMCQMIHYSEHAASKGLMIDDLHIRIEGRFKISRPRLFSEITYFVDIRSQESIEEIRELASSAASDCYITNTLSKSCDVNGLLMVNGNDMGKIGIA